MDVMSYSNETDGLDLQEDAAPNGEAAVAKTEPAEEGVKADGDAAATEETPKKKKKKV